MQWTNTASNEIKIRLVARYQKLDNIVTEYMLRAANSIGRKNYGYQRSEELITAAYKLCFWRSVLLCKKRKAGYTKRVKELAEKLGIPTETYASKSHKETRKELQQARKEKKAIQNRDGEARAKWLKEIAQEKAKADPTQYWENVLEK